MRKLLPLLIAIFVIFVLGNNQMASVEASISPDWTVLRPIFITAGENGMPENYQIKIAVPWDDNMRSDFGDVRFVLDGEVLPYWIEKLIPENYAEMWVRLPFSLAPFATKTIYMYYGNPNATRADNGDATFLFFDDGTRDKRAQYIPEDVIFKTSTTSALVYDDSNKRYYVGVTATKEAVWLIPVDGENYEVYVRTLLKGIDGNTQVGLNMRFSASPYRQYLMRMLNYRSPDFIEIDAVPRDAVFPKEKYYSGDVMMHEVWYEMRGRTYGKNAYFWTSLENNGISATHTAPIPSGKIGLHFYSATGEPKFFFSFDFVRVRNYVEPEPAYSIGEEGTISAPIILSISADNILLDRDIDFHGSDAVIGARLQADVDFISSDLIGIKENVEFKIYDALDTIIATKTAVENLQLTPTVQRFFVHYRATDNVIADGQLGSWHVVVKVRGPGGVSENKQLKVFSVADLTATTTIENLPKHRIRVKGTVSAISVHEITPLMKWVKLVDNNIGEIGTKLIGLSYENSYAPLGSGWVRPKLAAENLDGWGENKHYHFPNIPPEIVSITSSENLVDRKTDVAASGAKIATVVTVRVRDIDGTEDLDRVGLWIRDNKNVTKVDNVALTAFTTVNENVRDYTYTYNPEDNLPDVSLGQFKGDAEARDIYRGSAKLAAVPLFIVDDVFSTITVSPPRPYYRWEATFSGKITRASGLPVDIPTHLLFFDNKEGGRALTLAETWETTYVITSLPKENVGISISIVIGTLNLDGYSACSYVVNENWLYEHRIIWEDNFENVGSISRDWKWRFVFYTKGGEIENKEIKKGRDSVVFPHELVFGALWDDNSNYYRKSIPDGRYITFYMVGDPANVAKIAFYQLTLEDPMQQWGPPAGKICLYRIHEKVEHYISSDYWSAMNTTNFYLIFCTTYNVRLFSLTGEILDYGMFKAGADTAPPPISPLRIMPAKIDDLPRTPVDIFSFSIYWDNEVDSLVAYFFDETTLAESAYVRIAVDDNTVYTGAMTKETPFKWTTQYVGDRKKMHEIVFTINHPNYREPVVFSGRYIPPVVLAPPPKFPSEVFGADAPIGTLLAGLFAVMIILALGPKYVGVGIFLSGVFLVLLVTMGFGKVFSWEFVILIFIIGFITLLRRGER